MPDFPSTARELLESALEFTKGWVGVQPGPRIFLPQLQDWHSGPKERLRANPQTRDRDTADTVNSPDTTDTASIHQKSAAATRAGGPAPRPPRFIACGQSRRAKTETGHRKQSTASRLRSWLLARRSGRVSASPCPPVRYFQSIRVITAEHSPCAPAPVQSTKFFIAWHLTNTTLSGKGHPFYETRRNETRRRDLPARLI